MTDTKKLGDVYYCDTTTKQLELVAQPFINRLNRITLTAGSLATSIRNEILNFERQNLNGHISDEEIEKNIIHINDVTYKFVSVGRWRRGFGYVILQLSNLNGGNARITVYVTNSVHHTGGGFATTPGCDEAMKLVNDYIANVKIVKDDITKLKTEHQTVKSVDELYENIKVLS